MPHWIVLDWETVSGLDLKKVGAYRYAQDPTTDILCGTLGDAKHRVTWRPGLPVPPIVHRALAEGWIFVAHNTQFERCIWRDIATPEYGWPQCPPLEQWHDTMSRGLQLALPGGLEDVLKVLELKHRKDTEGSKLTIGLSKPDKHGKMPERTPEILERVYAYCESDIDGEVELHKRIGWLPACEREPWIMAQEMNDRGIYLDMEFVRACQAIVDQVVPKLTAEFLSITGLKVASPKVLGWLHKQGVHLDNLQKATIAEALEDDDEEDSDAEEWEDHTPISAKTAEVLLPNIRRALEIKQLIGSASIKKLKTMDQVVCWDGRAKGMIVYHGTTPGRGTAKLLQVHNFPKPTIKVEGKGHDPEILVSLIKARDAELLEMNYGVGAVEVVVSGLRHALCAEPGHRLMSGDYSGIQARVVLAFAGQHDKTAMLAAGLDAYIDMACDIWPQLKRPLWADKDAVEDWKARHPKERGTGKNSVLGLGFQMGPHTFQVKYAKDQPIEFCETVVRTYRKVWAPKVPLFWYDQQDAAIECVWSGHTQEAHGIIWRREDQWLTAEVPNGRGSKLWYANPRAVRRAMPWDPEDIRRGFRYQVWKKGMWMTRDAFGGQLTENLVMKIEREIMEDAKRRLKRYGYPLVLEVHDENVVEVPNGQGSLDEFKLILEDVEPWVRALRIPIQVDEWEGGRYRK